MMCLAKDPAQRPPSAESLARMLEDADGVDPWTAEDAERWWNENLPADIVSSEAAEQDEIKIGTNDPGAIQTLGKTSNRR